MWANMRIVVLLNALKVGSLRTRQMLKVDLCANGAGAYAPYAPYAPPLPTGLGPSVIARWPAVAQIRGLGAHVGECARM